MNSVWRDSSSAALLISLIAGPISVHPCVVAADSSLLDRLRVGSEVPTPAPAGSAEERSVIKTAEAAPAERLIQKSQCPVGQISVPLRGSIAEYVATVVSPRVGPLAAPRV